MATTFEVNVVISPSMSGEMWTPVPVEITTGFSISPALSGTMLSPVHYYSVGAYIDFPSFSVSGEGIGSILSNAWMSFPVFTLSATGIISSVGHGNVVMPVMSLSATGRTNPVGAGDIIMPVMKVATAGVVGSVGNADIVFPNMTLSVAAALYAFGNAETSFPSFRIDATISSGAVGNFDKDMPAFSLSASGIGSIIGTASIFFPAMRLSATAVTTPAGAGSGPVVAGVYVSPYLSLVMNLKNRALTEFSNYNFNSLCSFNGKSFGATSTAIYDLSGDTDAGTLIDWNFRTGYLDLEQKAKKKLRQAWLSYKTDGDLILTVLQPNEESYEYHLEGIDTTETGVRMKFGKGIRSKYVALDIKNVDGSTIVLDALKLVLEKTSKPR
jgi:hypothetical protein